MYRNTMRRKKRKKKKELAKSFTKSVKSISGNGSFDNSAFHMNDRMNEPRRDLLGYGIS